MFEIVPHTADVAVRGTGKTRDELLRALLRGMFEAAGPRWSDGSIVERTFSVVSHDPPALIVDLLSEALAMSDINKEAYSDVRFSSLTETSAEGVFVGAPIAGFETQIKAVTYHGLEIVRGSVGDGLEVTVTFDV